MQTSPLHNSAAPERLFRSAILNGVTPPPAAVSVLMARGVDVGELETRIRETMEFVR